MQFIRVDICSMVPHKILLSIIMSLLMIVMSSCQFFNEKNKDEEWYKQKRVVSTKLALADNLKFKDELTRVLVEQIRKEKRTGIGLFLFRKDDELIYAKTLGHIENARGIKSFTGIEVMPAGASSLWVSVLVILRLIEKDYFKLNSTVNEVLSWSEMVQTISLKGLLSMTSGLPGRFDGLKCISRFDSTIQSCMENLRTMIRENRIVLKPDGSIFSYGPIHIQLAIVLLR